MIQFVQCRRWICGAIGILALQAAPAFAQLLGAAGGQGGGTPAQPVPVSGRTAGGGSVTVSQTPVPGGGSGVSSLNPSILVQGAFAGSNRPDSVPVLSGPLSLADALRRGLEYNLGTLNLGELVNQARGQQTVARSSLMPNISSDITTIRQQINLAAMGVRFDGVPGFPSFPSVVGPFNQIDVRVRLSQALYDGVALNNYRAASENRRAAELSAEDANDVVVLAIAGEYLSVVAARARVEAVRAQLETANALLMQTEQRRAVGLAAQVEVGRSQVQALTQQLRLTTAQNDYAKQKINLARLVGLPPTDRYELGAEVSFDAAPVTLEDALRLAQTARADLKAAEAQVRAAERAQSAAHAERLPSASLSADYGRIGSTLPDALPTFSIVGRLRVPIWQGGHAGGVTAQAEAAVRQRRAELVDLGSQVEGDIRKAYLDVEAAASQVDVAVRNQDVARQTLDLTRQRFDAGITDNVEVVQAQEAVATAVLDYINSVFAHNLAKVSLARSMGVASERVAEFLRVP